MQVRAVYDHGKMELLEDIKLKHDRFHVVVEVPDEEVMSTAIHKERNIGEELNHILGQYRQENLPRTPAEDKDIWHAHLEDKYR